jgi:TonB family protein
MLALLPTVLSLFAVAAPPTITPAEAAKHVGEEVVVQGTIDQIATTVNLTTHINFGGRYPNHVFTATILKARQGLFTRVKTLEGTVAQVQGVVKLYRGKPEIMLNEPSQLRAAAAAEPAPAQAAASAAPASAGSPGAAAATPLPAVAALRFDPRGADFAAWVSQFKQEVSPTAMPEADLARAGRRTSDFEFVVERDGAISAVRMRKSSGTSTLDRAAANTLEKGHFLPLPPDYPDANVMMQATFVFGDSDK